MIINVYTEKSSEQGHYRGTPEEVVNWMRKEEWDPTPKTNKDYMDGVAKRAEIIGHEITYNNEWEFLKELERIGVIMKVKVEEE